MKKTRDAIASFQCAFALNPSAAQIQPNLGIAHEKRGRRDEALACHNNVLNLAPTHFHALNNCGAPWLQLKRPSRKIPIDSVSPDFRNHVFTQSTRNMYSLPDREQFVIYAYAPNHDDGSEVRRKIAEGQRARLIRSRAECSDGFASVSGQ